MPTWIVRLILVVLALEAGVCVAFLADDWSPLRHREEHLFETVLTATHRNRDFVVDEAEPVSRVRLVRPLKQGAPQPYVHVRIDGDEETKDVLESFPPSVLDWHLLLKQMHEVGCQVAAVEPPLTWKGEDFLQLHRLASLDRSLALFDVAVLTVDLQRLPPSQGQPIPDYLRLSAIPLANVRGELGGLIRVNRVMHAPSASAAPNLRFSFRIQESVEEVRPEFVRWDDYLIPSFPLAVAMAQHGVPPDQVRVELGRHIRLGDGPIVPIDEIGQLTDEMKLVDRPQQSELPAHQAILESEIPEVKRSAGETVPRCVLFADAKSAKLVPWKNHNDLQQLISSFDVLPYPSELETHKRLSLFSELAFLGLISVLAALLMTLQGVRRHLSFLLLIVILLGLLALLSVTAQKWMPLTPILATAIAGWLLSIRMARYLPDRENAMPAATAS